MGRPLIDIAGQQYGRLTVLSLVGRGSHCTWWLCRCDCGKEVEVRSHELRGKKRISCGCRPAALEHGNARHGARSAEYVVWLNMRQRCNDPGSSMYRYYGGRGIAVCERWRDSFEAFLADMGVRPGPDYSIDRIDFNGNYEPSNCRWATLKEQRRNMSSNRLVSVNGRLVCLVDACETLGLSYGTVRQRMYRGKTFEQAING